MIPQTVEAIEFDENVPRMTGMILRKTGNQ